MFEATLPQRVKQRTKGVPSAYCNFNGNPMMEG